MIGSGRDKIESQQDLQKAAAVATQLDLDGIVVVGGDDSNTNAAIMAEYFASQGEHRSLTDHDVCPALSGPLSKGQDFHI